MFSLYAFSGIDDSFYYITKKYDTRIILVKKCFINKKGFKPLIYLLFFYYHQRIMSLGHYRLP